MEKRFLFFALPIMALLSFVSCGDNDEETDSSKKEQSSPNGELQEEQSGNEESQKVEPSLPPNTNGQEYVDLGLPSGNLWATMNIGANTIEGNGNRFAWGETETKGNDRNNYSKEKYKFYEKGGTDEEGFAYKGGFTKYVSDDNSGCNGFKDGKRTLEPSDDVAFLTLGGDWRIPSLEDFEELVTYCKATDVTYKNIQGAKLTSKNGNWLFFPYVKYIASGERYGGIAGHYWTNGPFTHGEPYYYSFAYYDNKLWPGKGYDPNGYSVREFGMVIRAVCSSKK